MTKAYQANKKWRLRHTTARNHQRKTYYDQTSNAENSGAAWTREEIDLVMSHKVSDRELSEMLGRSVASIQKIRWKCNHGLN